MIVMLRYAGHYRFCVVQPAMDGEVWRICRALMRKPAAICSKLLASWQLQRRQCWVDCFPCVLQSGNRIEENWVRNIELELWDLKVETVETVETQQVAQELWVSQCLQPHPSNKKIDAFSINSILDLVAATYLYHKLVNPRSLAIPQYCGWAKSPPRPDGFSTQNHGMFTTIHSKHSPTRWCPPLVN